MDYNFYLAEIIPTSGESLKERRGKATPKKDVIFILFISA